MALQNIVYLSAEDFAFWKGKFSDRKMGEIPNELLPLIIELRKLVGLTVAWVQHDLVGSGYITLLVDGTRSEAFEELLSTISKDSDDNHITVEFKLAVLGKSKLTLPTWVLHWSEECKLDAVQAKVTTLNNMGVKKKDDLRERKEC